MEVARALIPRRRREINKVARHSHMNCAPTGAGYRIHQSTWWSTINMQPPRAPGPRSSFSLSLPPFFPSFSHIPSSFFFSSSSCVLEKARFVSPQRALLQVPDWLLNWHSLKYPSNACRERYVSIYMNEGKPAAAESHRMIFVITAVKDSWPSRSFLLLDSLLLGANDSSRTDVETKISLLRYIRLYRKFHQ